MAGKFKIAAWIGVGVLTGALATLQLQAVAHNAQTSLPLDELQQFAAVYGLIKADYFEPVAGKKLIHDAINGMVNSLDPHSEYLDAKDYKEFRESTSGQFVGVGIEITAEDGLIKVVSPIEGSPAAHAGIEAGDLITAIDNVPVKGMTLDQAVKRMRGKPGTQVTLTVLRKSQGRTLNITVTRAEIHVRSVRGKVVSPGYAWVRISQFQSDTLPDFVNEVDALYKHDPKLKGIVLDLRNNPGGLLESAVGVASVFLPADAVIVSTRGQIPEANVSYRNTPSDYSREPGVNPLQSLPDGIKKVPLVVLVNGGSASASEIVTGALQDYGRAKIMGTPTFGKGSVQTVLPLGPDTALKLTTARYYTPNGESIQAKGITPNFIVDPLPSGDPYAALRMREADYSNQIGTGGPASAAASAAAAQREARETAARRELELQIEKDPNKFPKLPQYGSKEDWQLQQALNELQGKPVVTAKVPPKPAASQPAAPHAPAAKPASTPKR